MRLSYYSFRILTKLFSVIPFGLLYFFSDGLFYLFYYLVPYRKKVIFQNINNSFPKMTEDEKRKLMKSFYKNLCDILLEGVKGFTMSEKQLTDRYKFINPEIMDGYFAKGQDVISVGAHYANWEWGIIAAPTQIKHHVIAFYTALSNKHIEHFMRDSRNKFGSELVAQSDVRKAFSRKKVKPSTYFFGADQSPSNTKGAHWMTFLNQDTACMKGHEFFAKHYNMPVVYFDVQRVKRGYYTVNLIPLIENSASTTSGEITEKYMQTLETIVIKKPEDYLWSHRKWKHKRTKTDF